MLQKKMLIFKYGIGDFYSTNSTISIEYIFDVNFGG